ncbi:MAG: sulfite exporter TauE/SafE family protein [Chloroflexi bacterium]|nr:MAG: sulfite exporter TauE/SafE family protein [Chloroflexota bacterium]
MHANPPAFYLITAFVIFLIGVSKGGLGGAAGAAATPLMALVMPVEQVLGLMLPLLMMADIFAVASHWRRWDNRLLLLLVPASLIGISAGTLLLTTISPDALRRGLAVIVILFVLYKLFEGRILRAMTYQPKGWHGMLTGIVAGFTSTLAHTGGPPVAIYLLMQQVTPRVFVATSAVYFAIINWLKVPYYIYAGVLDLNQLRQVVWLLPLIPVSVFVGRWLSTRIDKTTFDRVIIGLLAASALLLLK